MNAQDNNKVDDAPRQASAFVGGPPRRGPPQVVAAQATTIEVGASAEDRAVDLLVRRGYRIIERNYRCKVGELDVIARDDATLVFVEVRSRRTSKYGSALDAIGYRKQSKVSRVALHYIAWRRPSFGLARFDVVAITGDEIVLIQDAWRLGNRM